MSGETGPTMNASGAFSESVQSCLEYYLQRHFPAGRAVKSAAFGDNPFAQSMQASSKYYAFDWERVHDSPNRVLRSKSINILYIGGPYRFLDTTRAIKQALECLSDTGVLVLPCLNVPANYLCFQFIKDHPQFHLHFTMENTAFFGFHRLPSSGETGWWSEAYNVGHFPAFDYLAYSIRPKLPVRFAYDGYLSQCGPEFQTGFMTRSGRVVSHGYRSQMAFSLEAPSTRQVEVSIELRALDPASRPEAGLVLRVADADPVSVDLSAAAPVRRTISAALPDDNVLPIAFEHSGLVVGSELSEPEIDLPDVSFPNIELLSVAITECGETPPPVTLSQHQGSVRTFDHAGQTFRFFVDDPHDSIQAHHCAGEFYEIEELELIGAHVPANARILDIGANIGNHAVYFEKTLKAQKVTAIELQQRVISVLRLNVALNELKTVDLSNVGIGFGASSHSVRIQISQAFNVAGAHFDPDPVGGFEIRKGDDVVGNEDFDFIKIDVEGMECEVIEGLSQTIARCQPMLFVEVWNENLDRFHALLADLGYEVGAEFRRYDVATNLLMKARTYE